MPQISVIVPVYKVEQYLHRCVDSILAQTFSDFELILVDDGSPDGSGAICDDYAAKDARVRVIHKQNGGLSDARNVGLDWAFENSDSEWVTFIDSDDWIHREYLDMLLSALSETGLNLSVCEFARTTGDDIVVNRKDCTVEEWNTEDYFLQYNTNAIIACAKLYRKASFQCVRYPVGRLHEDEFTTYKLLFQHPQIAVIRQPLYCYYINPMSITESRPNTRFADQAAAFEERMAHFENTTYLRTYCLSVEMYVCRLFGALNVLQTSDRSTSEEKQRVKEKLRRVYRHRMKTLDKATQKRVRKEAVRYLKHSPNRLLIKCLGKDRYEHLKGKLHKS